MQLPPTQAFLQVAPVQVRFTPTATGLRTATLSIANNDSNENPYTVALTGSSTGPDIAVEQPAGLALADGEPRNNFLQRSLTWNPDGVLTGARHVVLGGSYAYFSTPKAMVIVFSSPHFAGTIGIGSVAAAIALADHRSTAVAIGSPFRWRRPAGLPIHCPPPGEVPESGRSGLPAKEVT